MRKKSPAETVATIIDSYAIDMDITAQKAKDAGATDEVMADYKALSDEFRAAADWLRTRTSQASQEGEGQ